MSALLIITFAVALRHLVNARRRRAIRRDMRMNAHPFPMIYCPPTDTRGIVRRAQFGAWHR